MGVEKWLLERYPELRGVLEKWQNLSWSERAVWGLRIGIGVVVAVTIVLIILSQLFPGWHGWGGKVENPDISTAPLAKQVILGEKGGN